MAEVVGGPERAGLLWVMLHGYAELAVQDRLALGGPGLRERLIEAVVREGGRPEP